MPPPDHPVEYLLQLERGEARADAAADAAAEWQPAVRLRAGVEERAISAGASRAYVVDARDRFVTDFVWPHLQANALYQGAYPLATALARPPFVATCSLWESTRDLATYAYGARQAAHPDAMMFDSIGISTSCVFAKWLVARNSLGRHEPPNAKPGFR